MEATADNDVATDDEEVKCRVNQGVSALVEAIKHRN